MIFKLANKPVKNLSANVLAFGTCIKLWDCSLSLRSTQSRIFRYTQVQFPVWKHFFVARIVMNAIIESESEVIPFRRGIRFKQKHKIAAVTGDKDAGIFKSLVPVRPEYFLFMIFP